MVCFSYFSVTLIPLCAKSVLRKTASILTFKTKRRLRTAVSKGKNQLFETTPIIQANSFLLRRTVFFLV